MCLILQEKFMKLVSFASKSRVSQQGFSLVELMVVVAIIGILSGVAFPKYQAFKARSRQSEAKAGLNGVYLSVSSYNSNYGDYPTVATSVDATTATAQIGFSVPSKRAYDYSIVSAPGAGGVAGGFASNGYYMAAGGIMSGRGDVQRINTNRWSCTTYDGVSNTGGVAYTAAKAPRATSPKDCPQSATSHAVGSAFATTYTAAADSED
jgi:type IV pilus assembly protein PilE